MLGARDGGFHQRALRREPRHRRLVHRARPAELDRQTRRLADCDERAARRQERGEGIDTGLTKAACEIGRFAVHAEKLVLVVLHVRLRTRSLCLHDRLPAQILLRHENHVVVLAQISLCDALLVNEVERNLELVERETIPAKILRTAPLRVDRHPRHVGVVQFHRGHAAQHRGGQAERVHERAYARRILAGHYKRTRRICGVAGTEGLLRHFHRHGAQQIAQRDHVIRPEVRHGDCRVARTTGATLEHDPVDR